MKKLSEFMIPIGVLCLLGTLGLSAFWLILVIAASFGLQWPIQYYRYLGLPVLAVSLPVIGMLVFLPFALRLAFGSGPATEEGKVGEPRDSRKDLRKGGGKIHLRHA